MAKEKVLVLRISDEDKKALKEVTAHRKNESMSLTVRQLIREAQEKIKDE